MDFPSIHQHLKDARASSGDLASASTSVLEVLAKDFDCQWAVYWNADDDRQAMCAIATWTGGQTQFEDFRRDTESRTLALGQGAVGLVWRSRKPIGTNRLIRDMCLPRSLLANAAGLSGGIWFPVFVGHKINAIIELLAAHSLPSVEELSVGLMGLGQSIGAMKAGT